MKATRLDLPSLVLIELDIRRDSRGFFCERFHAGQFEKLGLPSRFVQDNHSRSAPGVLRGLHYQFDPPQSKLVGVAHGSIWDVVVDIRPDSATFGRNLGIELSDQNGRLLWVPDGFAHGFCVLGDVPADVIYKVDAFYNPRGEGGIRWNDADLAISWPLTEPLVSDRDERLPSFADFRASLPSYFRKIR